jgi:hypothetical protein
MRNSCALAFTASAAFFASLMGVAAAQQPGISYAMAFTTNTSFPYAHNSGWAALPSGRIAVVFQASKTREGAASQAIYISMSDDGGATFPGPSRLIAGNGSAAAWAPAAWADGPLLRVFYAQTPPGAALLCGDILHISSADGGLTWSAPDVMLGIAAWGGGPKCTDNKPAQVAANRWALPFFEVARGGAVTGLLASQPGAGMAGPWAPLAGGIPPPPHFNATDYLSEPAVASCSAALPMPPPAYEMLALLRNYEKTWAARSHDGGASWSAPFATPLTNPYSKVDLAVWLASTPRGPQPGALLLAHNPVQNCSEPVYCARKPLAVSWSQDCGAQWSRPLIVVSEAAHPHGASYPTVGPCGESRVCVSYTLYGDGAGTGTEFAGIQFASFDASLLAPY